MNNKDKACDSCKDCIHNHDYCHVRENLPINIGEKLIKDGIEYTKSCPEFEWD